METKQIIIYAIVAFAVYKLFIEKEGFAFRTTDTGLGLQDTSIPNLGGHIRMRQNVDCNIPGNCPGIVGHVRTRNMPQYEGFSHNNQRGAMNFAHSSHIKNHIRSNRKNSMLNGMVNGEPQADSGGENPYA
jgi:hypothetical protein